MVDLKGEKAPGRFKRQFHMVSFVINPMNWVFTPLPSSHCDSFGKVSRFS